MKIKNITNGCYNFNGDMEFLSDNGKIEMHAKDALEIAYTLFDWAGLPYTQLDELNEKFDD